MNKKFKSLILISSLLIGQFSVASDFGNLSARQQMIVQLELKQKALANEISLMTSILNRRVDDNPSEANLLTDYRSIIAATASIALMASLSQLSKSLDELYSATVSQDGLKLAKKTYRKAIADFSKKMKKGLSSQKQIPAGWSISNIFSSPYYQYYISRDYDLQIRQFAPLVNYLENLFKSYKNAELTKLSSRFPELKQELKNADLLFEKLISEKQKKINQIKGNKSFSLFALAASTSVFAFSIYDLSNDEIKHSTYNKLNTAELEIELARKSEELLKNEETISTLYYLEQIN